MQNKLIIMEEASINKYLFVTKDVNRFPMTNAAVAWRSASNLLDKQPGSIFRNVE
jgi:hypothetical protein